jgi:hypothetical protein
VFTRKTNSDQSLEAVLGIALDERFRIGDQLFRLRKNGYRVTSRVNAIGTLWSKFHGIGNTLLPFRSELRVIADEPVGASLTLLARRTHNLYVRRLAIWLIGRGQHQLARRSMAEEYKIESNPRTRRQLASTLKRLHAWTELREIERREVNERVRNVARQIPSARRTARIELLRRSNNSLPCPQSSMPMFASELSESRSGKLPKSMDIIRRILDRISKLIGRT